jgi:hypothetical protein
VEAEREDDENPALAAASNAAKNARKLSTSRTTRQYYGSPLAPHEQVPVPEPAALRIVQYDDDGGFYLLYLDSDCVELTDTWHETLDDAKRQAEFEFGVQLDEWPEARAGDSEAAG